MSTPRSKPDAPDQSNLIEGVPSQVFQRKGNLPKGYIFILKPLAENVLHI